MIINVDIHTNPYMEIIYSNGSPTFPIEDVPELLPCHHEDKSHTSCGR